MESTEQTNVEGDQNIVNNPPEGDAPEGEAQPTEVPAGEDSSDDQ